MYREGKATRARVARRVAAASVIAVLATTAPAGMPAVDAASVRPAVAAHTARVTSCPAGGTVIPVSDSTAAVRGLLAPVGGSRVFCWAPGIHHVTSTLSMHPGDTFLGLADPVTGARPVIDGSKPLVGWVRQSATRWVGHFSWLTPPPINTAPGAACIDRTTHCAYPDDVFAGNTRLTRVWSLSKQGSGDYFVDYAAKQIYVGLDPAKHPVTRAAPLPIVSGQPQPLIHVLPGGTVQGLVIRECGVGTQGAAIAGYQATVTDVDVHFCHGRGVDLDDLSTVTDDQMYSNGQSGIILDARLPGATGPPGLVSGNDVYRNGWSLCATCGGIKGSTSDGVTIENNNVHDNFGTGIWMDNDSIDYTIDGNTITGNSTAGVMIEISYNGLVQNNTLLGNGIHPVEPIKVGAIHVLASGGCTANCPANAMPGIVIRQNTVGSVGAPNAFGVLLREQARGSGAYGPHAVGDVSVSDNAITLCGKSSPPVATTYTGADTSVDNSVYSSNNQFSGNDYTLSSAGLPAFRWLTSAGAGNGWLTFAGWQQQGNDVSGSMTTASC